MMLYVMSDLACEVVINRYLTGARTKGGVNFLFLPHAFFRL